MKKSIAILVCVMLITSSFITGCGNKKDGDTSSSKADKKIYTEVGTYPVVKEKITLKVLAPSYPHIKDIATNQHTKWLEEKTGIHLEWQMVPADSLKEKLNVLLATGDYPDILYGCGLNSDQQSKFGVTEKIIIPLNDLIEENAVAFKEVMKQHDGLKGTITETDGNIYALPTWNDCFHCNYAQKLWINQDWLNKLGLKMPETTDEFYEVLKAFKTRDPNGNGKQDEIPLTGSIDGWFANPDSFIMNAFILDPSRYEKVKTILIDDSKVDTIANKEEYREGLRYLNKLYKEGLIGVNSFTQKSDQVKQLIANADANLVGAFTDGVSVDCVEIANKERYKAYTPLAPLTGPKGVKQSTFFKYNAIGEGQFAITKACKYPEAAIRMADLLYTTEGALNHRYGAEGVGWEKAAEGTVGINGKPALYHSLLPYSVEPQDNSYLFLGIEYLPEEIRLGDVTNPNVDPYSPEGLEKMLYDETSKKYEPYASKNASVMPPIKLLTEENEALSTITVELEKAISETEIRFIIGDLDLDKDWDSYVKNLDKIGLKKYLDTYQKAYDRQFKNKK